MVYIELTLCLPGNVKNNAKHKHDFTSMAKSSELPGKYEKQNLRWIVTQIQNLDIQYTKYIWPLVE